MTIPKSMREISIPYTTITTDLAEPILLQEAGTAIAAVMSMEDYAHYQALRTQEERISATAARRAANRALFQDLVGCALSVGEPLWVPEPTPHWRVPYRLFTGEIVALIQVDAESGQVALDAETRNGILQKVKDTVPQ